MAHIWTDDKIGKMKNLIDLHWKKHFRQILRLDYYYFDVYVTT